MSSPEFLSTFPPMKPTSTNVPSKTHRLIGQVDPVNLMSGYLGQGGYEAGFADPRTALQQDRLPKLHPSENPQTVRKRGGSFEEKLPAFFGLVVGIDEERADPELILRFRDFQSLVVQLHVGKTQLSDLTVQDPDAGLLERVQSFRVFPGSHAGPEAVQKGETGAVNVGLVDLRALRADVDEVHPGQDVSDADREFFPDVRVASEPLDELHYVLSDAAGAVFLVSQRDALVDVGFDDGDQVVLAGARFAPDLRETIPQSRG